MCTFTFKDCVSLFQDRAADARLIKWPGYSDWSSQIMTRDQTIVQNTITLEQFAKRVANAVGRFLDVSLPPSSWNLCGHVVLIILAFPIGAGGAAM
jgi:hypothetical protein